MERQVGSDGSDGGKTDEDAGGYAWVYAKLGVEKRRDGYVGPLQCR